MITALFGLVAFAASIALGALLLCLLIVKAAFGLILLPLRLAAAGVKLVGAILLVALVIPVVAVGAPLLALAAIFLAFIAPVALVLWGLSKVPRTPTQQAAG